MPEAKDLEKKFLQQLTPEEKKRLAKNILKQLSKIQQKKYDLLLFGIAVFLGLGTGLFSSALANFLPNSLFIQIIIGAGIVAFALYELKSRFWQPLTERERPLKRQYETITENKVILDI